MKLLHCLCGLLGFINQGARECDSDEEMVEFEFSALNMTFVVVVVLLGPALSVTFLVFSVTTLSIMRYTNEKRFYSVAVSKALSHILGNTHRNPRLGTFPLEERREG